MFVNNLGLKSPWYDLLGFLEDCLQISKYTAHILQEGKPPKRLGQSEETVQERTPKGIEGGEAAKQGWE